MLRFPPFPTDNVGPQEIQGREHGSDPGHPLLAEETLVCNAAKSSHKAPLETTIQKGFANTRGTEPSGKESSTVNSLVSEEDLLGAKGLAVREACGHPFL